MLLCSGNEKNPFLGLFSHEHSLWMHCNIYDPFLWNNIMNIFCVLYLYDSPSCSTSPIFLSIQLSDISAFSATLSNYHVSSTDTVTFTPSLSRFLFICYTTCKNVFTVPASISDVYLGKPGITRFSFATTRCDLGWKDEGYFQKKILPNAALIIQLNSKMH